MNEQAGEPLASDAASRRAVACAYFLLFLGAGVWVPYAPLYLQALGLDGRQMGLLIGLQPALRWASGLAWSWLADASGTRARLLVWTAVAGALCHVPLLVASDFGTLLGVLTVIGVLHGGLMPMLDATVLDHLPRLGGDYGRVRLWGSLAFIAGSAGSAPLMAAFSPRLLPALLLAPAALLGFALARIPREQHRHASHGAAPQPLVTPPLRALLATVFVIHLSSGAWTGFYGTHTAALGLSRAVPGITFGLAVVAEIAVFLWARPLLVRFTPQISIACIVAFTAVRWLLTSDARHAAWVVTLQLGHAITFSTFHLASLLLLMRLVPAGRSTAGQALYGLLGFGLGGSLGIGFAGLVVDRIGTAELFAWEGGMAVVAMAPALWLIHLLRGGRGFPPAGH